MQGKAHVLWGVQTGMEQKWQVKGDTTPLSSCLGRDILNIHLKNEHNNICLEGCYGD